MIFLNENEINFSSLYKISELYIIEFFISLLLKNSLNLLIWFETPPYGGGYIPILYIYF